MTASENNVLVSTRARGGVAFTVGVGALLGLAAVAPLFVSRSTVQDLFQIVTLLVLAQCWNLLAGYAGLVSVGQQAFVGVGAYAMFAAISLLGLDPLTAIGNLARLGRPGALVLITTPFLIRVHPQPIDFWRFTPDGLRALIEAQGLTVTDVGSWGNKWCVLANHGAWRPYLWRHRVLSRWTLRDDAASPQMVWAFARVPNADAGQGET